jgi:hypothetical protein
LGGVTFQIGNLLRELSFSEIVNGITLEMSYTMDNMMTGGGYDGLATTAPYTGQLNKHLMTENQVAELMRHALKAVHQNDYKSSDDIWNEVGCQYNGTVLRWNRCHHPSGRNSHTIMLFPKQASQLKSKFEQVVKSDPITKLTEDNTYCEKEQIRIRAVRISKLIKNMHGHQKTCKYTLSRADDCDCIQGDDAEGDDAGGDDDSDVGENEGSEDAEVAEGNEDDDDDDDDEDDVVVGVVGRGTPVARQMNVEDEDDVQVDVVGGAAVDLTENECGSDFVPFPIPKNVSPVNEVEQFVQDMWIDGTKKSKKLFIQALFDLVCAQACNEITESQKPDKIHAIYDLAATEFTNAMTTFLTKSYIMENFQVYLPGKKWPDDFVTFIATIQFPLPVLYVRRENLWVH